jgi:hypothetical protein
MSSFFVAAEGYQRCSMDLQQAFEVVETPKAC